MLNGATFIRRELMIRIVRAFDDGTLENELDQIPIKLRPKNSAASFVGCGSRFPHYAAMPDVEPIGAIWYTIRRQSQTRRRPWTR